MKISTLESLGKGMEIWLTLATGDTYTWAPGTALTFNKIKQNNSKTKNGRIMCFEEGDSAIKTRVCGRWAVTFDCTATPAATTVFNITDNEGNNDYTSGAVGSTAFARLYIDECKGTISVINAGTVAIVLTGNATNSTVPVAKVEIDYLGA